MAWTNADGLEVLMHGEQGNVNGKGSTVTSVRNQLVVAIEDATNIPSSADTPGALDGMIPAGAYITNAYFIVETGFTSGGAATLDIGLYQKDGTVIDADGVDAAIALAAIDTAGEVVVNDGALVGGTATVGANDAYVELKYNTAAYTAGAAKLVIEYIMA